MSETIATHGSMQLTRFAGGRDRGVCYQLTSTRPDEDFVTMDERTAWAIAFEITADIIRDRLGIEMRDHCSVHPPPFPERQEGS